MSLRIVNKNSTVQDKAPIAADLVIGEIAVNANVNSPAAYIKDSAGNIVKLAGSGSVGDDWTRTGTALSPKTAGDTIQFSTGTAALPGITPVGNTSTGIYSPGANQVAISTNGTGRLFVDASGKVGVGTATPQSELVVRGSTPQITLEPTGDTQNCRLQFTLADGTIQSIIQGGGSLGSVITFNQGSSERARIDSSGRLLVGTSSVTDSNVKFAVEGRGVGGAHPAQVHLRRSEAATAVTSGENIGFLVFSDNADNQFAVIGCSADADAGSGDYPGRLVFSTTADGASSPTERMRIKSTGIVNVGNTPVYADNAAAKTGGLVDGDIYRKSDGTLMIVYT